MGEYSVVGVRIGLVESRSTLRQAVRFSLRGLPCELVEAQEPSALELEHSDAASFSLLILSSQYLTGESEFLAENRVPTISLGDSGGLRPSVDLPFQSQALVELVCDQLGIDIPDAALYAPYREEIPIAAKQDLNESPATPKDAPQSSGQEGQTIEVAPIPDDEQEETADFEDSVRTDTMSEGEAQAHIQASVKPVIVESSPAADMSGVDADDSLADEAEFDDSDSFTNPVDVLPPLSDGSLEDADLLEARRIEPSHHVHARPKLTPAEELDSSGTVSESEVHEHDDSMSDETTIRRGPAVDEFDADAHQNLSVSKTTDLAHNLEQLIQDDSFAAKLELPQEVVERVAWAVVPALAERIIREEIIKLLRDAKPGG